MVFQVEKKNKLSTYRQIQVIFYILQIATEEQQDSVEECQMY